MSETFFIHKLYKFVHILSILIWNLVNHVSKRDCNLRLFFVEQLRIQRAERTSDKSVVPQALLLCINPERGWSSYDRWHPCFVVTFVFATTFPWRVDGVSSFLPHTCYASDSAPIHSTESQFGARLDCCFCQRMCCDGHMIEIVDINSHEFHIDIGRREPHFKDHILLSVLCYRQSKRSLWKK